MVLGKLGEIPLWGYLLGFLSVGVFLFAGVTDPQMGFLWLFFGIFILGCLLVVVPIDLHTKWIRRKAHEKAFALRAQFEVEQRAKGLIRFVDRFGGEKWGAPEQVEEWKMLDKGLVKHKGKWVTAGEKIKGEREERERFEREQTEKGLVKFVDRLGRERWGTAEQVKEWKIVDMDMQNHFARLKPREFERLVAHLFTKSGYEVGLTQETADFGADIVAKKDGDIIVIQVKKYSYANKVGNRDVQRLLGSMWKYGANKAIFVTSSDYTNFAYEQSRGAPIELWNCKKLCEMIEKHILRLNKSFVS